MRGGAERWGYHRLAEPTARRLVERAGIEPGDLVLDLGAGDGAITRQLLAAGARVVAFELHPGRFAALRGALCSSRLTVVCADIRDLRLPRRPFKVVSNPPWAVSATVINGLTARGSRLLSADLVLPWHMTRRIVRRGRPGWSVHEGMAVPRRGFVPAPPEGASVLRIEPDRRDAPARSRRGMGEELSPGLRRVGSVAGRGPRSRGMAPS